MTEPEETAASEADVVAHLARVAARVARRIVEEVVPEGPERAEAITAAEAVLMDDEGARELLGAAFDEGRRDALTGVLASGAPSMADWSDVEGLGERRAIQREEHACGSCLHERVCVVPAAVRGAGLLVVLRRCDRYLRA